MADSRDTDRLKTFLVEIRQMDPLNGVLGERFRVSTEPEILQPIANPIRHCPTRFCPTNSLPRNV